MCELSVIIPTYKRSRKLQTLLDGLAHTEWDHSAFEVIVVVDGEDDEPLKCAKNLPDSIRFKGFTKQHAGPAAARNFGINKARGDWIIFFDDDARVNAQTLGGHLKLIRQNPDATLAYLGRVDWPEELIDSPWREMLARTSMLFFWDQMTSRNQYGFRHFWTSNLSVKREFVLSVGGFNEQFPSAMHEDIELGWRLHEKFGLEVHVDKSIISLHDHALDPCDYLLREYKSGRSAQAAKSINPLFHEQIWAWVDNPKQQLKTLETLFIKSACDVLGILQTWSQPSDIHPSREELHTTYLAHLPLKRMMFLQGYLNRPFDEMWERLQGSVATKKPRQFATA